MAKMGRPPVDNPKGHTVSFRMNEEQFIRLREYSSRYDVTLTQVIQNAVDAFLDGSNPGSVSAFPASERSSNGGKKRQQGKSTKKGGNPAKK